MAPFDVMTYGEGLLRLSTRGDALFSESRTLAMHAGGSEANVAVGLARLGWRAAWISRLKDDAVGRYICNAVAAGGADVSLVGWTEEGRNGLYFVEAAPEPRSSSVLYDRSATAFERVPATGIAVPEDAVGPGTLFHASGINLALGANVVAALRRLAERTKRAGGRFSFDTNVRRSLVDAGHGATFHDIAALADILFIPARDARWLYGAEADDADALLSRVRRAQPSSVVVMTLGGDGAAAAAPGGPVVRTPAVPTPGTHRIGRGDAFVAGFLSAYLDNDQDLEAGLRLGAAAAALKATLPGDLPLLRKEELDRLADPSGARTGLER